MNGEVTCRNCGEVVDWRRVDLGYDYCTKSECQQRCLDRVRLVSLGVNKAADYIDRADDSAPAMPLPAGLVHDTDDHGRPSREPTARVGRKRPYTTLERLRAAAHAVDARLGATEERFSRGEVTALEMKAEQRTLVGAFNALVRSENIRYRSLLRPEP